MKEMWKKYKRQIQIGGGICLIAALGIGGYVAANQDAAVQTQTEMKKETKSSDQKIAKNDAKDASSDSEKKMDTKQEAEKKTDTKSEKTAEKKETIAKKSENSDNKNSVEKSDKKESVKAEKETGKTESSSKPEQKPSQPESKPEQNPSKPQTKPESKPEQKPSQPESKPEKPQHTHTWQEKTHTVNHPEVGHNEQYVVKEAWTETVTEDVYDPWECCNVCGADCTADPWGHMFTHAENGEGGGYHTEYYKKVTRTVEHPAEYGTRYVVDTPAWTETVSDGFFCTGCGAKK